MHLVSRGPTASPQPTLVYTVICKYFSYVTCVIIVVITASGRRPYYYYNLSCPQNNARSSSRAGAAATIFALWRSPSELSVYWNRGRRVENARYVRYTCLGIVDGGVSVRPLWLWRSDDRCRIADVPNRRLRGIQMPGSTATAVWPRWRSSPSCCRTLDKRREWSLIITIILFAIVGKF